MRQQGRNITLLHTDSTASQVAEEEEETPFLGKINLTEIRKQDVFLEGDVLHQNINFILIRFFHKLDVLFLLISSLCSFYLTALLPVSGRSHEIFP